MTTAHKITAVLAVALFVFLCFAGYGALKEHDARLKAEDATNVAKADMLKDQQNEAANQAQLKQSISTLETAKKQVVTTQEIVREVPKYITLPAPIREVTADAAPADAAKQGDLIIPAESTKQFFQDEVTCKENSLMLDACKATTTNLQDEVVTQENLNKALNIQLKGGTKWQRAKTALKWAAIGGAVVGIGVAVHK